MPMNNDTTMAEAGDKAARFQLVQHPKATKKTKATTDIEADTKYSFKFPMRIHLTAKKSSTKSTYKPLYNPIPKTKLLMMTMAAYAKGLTISSVDGKNTIMVNFSLFPKTKEHFKKYFTLDWEKGSNNKPETILLGVTINCNQTLNMIKHSSNLTHSCNG